MLLNHLILCHPLLLLPSINCSQHQGLFQWVSFSHQAAKGLELQLQHQSYQWIFRVDFLLDWPVWSPWCPSHSQESSSASQFESINTSVLCFLHGSTLTSIHDYWKNHSFEYIEHYQQNDVSAFNTVSSFVINSFQGATSFNVIAAVTISNDFGVLENKICHCFHCLPFYLLWSDGTGCHDFSFLNWVLSQIFSPLSPSSRGCLVPHNFLLLNVVSPA